MPSNSLAAITQQIEDHGTDSFSKFYMYAGLLNVITVRDRQSIFQLQPKTSPLVFAPKSLNSGHFDAQFATQLNVYLEQFEPPTPDVLTAVKKIVMAYFRKGQLADMAFIIDKMLGHLSTNPLKPTDRENKSVYNEINFEQKQQALYQFVQTVSVLNNQLLADLDNGVHATLSAAVAVAGAIVMLVSIFSLSSFLLGAAMVAGGIYGVSIYAEHARGFTQRLQNCANEMTQATQAMNSSLSTYESLINNGNHINFIQKAVVKPLFFAALTVQEQLTVDAETASSAAQSRRLATNTFN